MRMLTLFVATISLILLAGADGPDAKAVKKRLTVDELRDSAVVGEFGFPLGESFKVDAKIVTLPTKEGDGRYALDVMKVEGKPCGADPVYFTSRAFEVPSDQEEVREHAESEDGIPLTDDEWRELEKEYIGREFKLVVYESGRFAGIPKLPKGELPWQGRPWHFETYLVVVDNIDEQQRRN